MRGLAPGREFELSLSDRWSSARPERLARAVSNLLDNAVKFSPADQPIEVSVRGRRADRARPRPGDSRAATWRRSSTASIADRARDVPGSGLGLAIVKQVADAHGGSVDAANAPGGGAVFSLRLAAA